MAKDIVDEVVNDGGVYSDISSQVEAMHSDPAFLFNFVSLSTVWFLCTYIHTCFMAMTCR